MPRIQFIENEYILPPYISADVNFNEFSEIKDVPDKVAIYLLRTHPNKFMAVDGFLAPPIERAQAENMVKLRFLHNNLLDEYHSTGVSFTKFGQVKMVDAIEARHLIEVHGDKFQLAEKSTPEILQEPQVADLPEEIEVRKEPKKNEPEELDLRAAVLKALTGGEQKISDIASTIGNIHFRSLQPIIDALLEEDIIQVRDGQVEGRNYTSKFYLLK